MRFACRFLFGIIATLAVVAALRSDTAQADPLPGEYTLALALADAVVPVGGETQLYVSIDRSDQPPYQFAQWFVGYDPAMVQVTLVEPAALAPAACDEMISSPFRVLLGCRDRSGPTIEFSGIAYIVSLRCLTQGAMPFLLRFAFGPDAHRTFVRTTGADTDEPIHTHDALLTCGDGPRGPSPTFEPLLTATFGARTMTAVADLSVTPLPTATPVPTRPSVASTALAPPPTPPPATATATSTPARTRTPARTASATPAPASSPDDNGSSSLSPWAVVGVIALGATAVGATGGWWWAKRAARP